VLVPTAIFAGLASLTSYRVKKREKGVLTPARQAQFEQILNDKSLTASQIASYAKMFHDFGLRQQANVLAGRAKLAGNSVEKKAALAKIVKDTLALQDPDRIERIAREFDKMYAVGSAQMLRTYAQGMRAGMRIQAQAPPKPRPLPPNPNPPPVSAVQPPPVPVHPTQEEMEAEDVPDEEDTTLEIDDTPDAPETDDGEPEGSD